MLERLKRFRSDESLRRGLGLAVRPDDVFISTYSKSGTTWLQQVVHGLRSGGSMDFDEISGVVPWLESAIDTGIDPDANQPWSPRAFKAHLEWERIPKGGRYITAFRDPATVLLSFYRFFAGWLFEPGTVTLEDFAHEFYMSGSESGRHWDHLTGWYRQIDNPDVLTLTYEDMVAEPNRVPMVVAEFLGLDVDAATMQLVEHQSSRNFMAVHQRQFDDHLTRDARDELMGLPPGSSTAKVYAAAPNLRLTTDLIADLETVWRREITSALGFESYAEMRASLPNPLGAIR